MIRCIALLFALAFATPATAGGSHVPVNTSSYVPTLVP